METDDRYFDYKCSNGMETVWNAKQSLRYLNRLYATKTARLMDVSKGRTGLLQTDPYRLEKALDKWLPEIRLHHHRNHETTIEYHGARHTRYGAETFDYQSLKLAINLYYLNIQIQYYKNNPWEYSLASSVKNPTITSHDEEQAELVMDALCGSATRRAEIRWNKKHTGDDQILDQDEAIQLADRVRKEHGKAPLGSNPRFANAPYQELYQQAFAKDIKRYGLNIPSDRWHKAEATLEQADPQLRKDLDRARQINSYAHAMYAIQNKDGKYTAQDIKDAKQDLTKIKA